MVLMVHDGDSVDFFMLARDHNEGKPFYSLAPWRQAGPFVDIEADGAAVPAAVTMVLSEGIPLPRHGSLFGWLSGTEVTALVTVYTEYALEHPEPSWAVLPLAAAPARLWPPFTGEQLFGSWFWENFQAGVIVSLAAVIAECPGTAFWVGGDAALGWDCCVVSRDLKSDAGYVLQRGCYLHYEALRKGVTVPPLESLLAGQGMTDLAPRLMPLADSSRCADGM